jgi:uncharacterized protein
MENTMPDPHAETEIPAWRPVVQAAAREAAIVEMRATRGRREIAFNYRWEHVRAVVRLALRLAERTGADRDVVQAAAWLHDVAKGHSKNHGPDGAIAARRILAGTDFSPGKIEAVADAISKHVGLWTETRIEPLEAAIVWDADKLTKLGATAVLHASGYYIARDKGTTAELRDFLSDDEWKARIARTVRSFNTAPARAAAPARLEAYLAFCRQTRLEYNGADL